MTASCSTFDGLVVLHLTIFRPIRGYASVMCIWVTCPGIRKEWMIQGKLCSCWYNSSSHFQDQCCHMSTSLPQFLNLRILQNVRIQIDAISFFLFFFILNVGDCEWYNIRIPTQNLMDFSMFRVSSSCKICSCAARNQISQPIFIYNLFNDIASSPNCLSFGPWND
jgi:hypothetical protein